jgi:hypothetical protein
MHIELYSIGSQLNCALEGRKRVLGMRLVRPSVRDPLGRLVVSACGQAFLRVVAL